MNSQHNRSFLYRSKFKASAIHLVLSSCIFLILAYFIVFEWYPFPYFTADGGWQGIRMVALIDLILGPFLTFIIFNPWKSVREIRFDLGIIGFVQMSVLAWGVHTVYNERPTAIVHWDGAFYTIPAKTLSSLNIPSAQLNQFSHEQPPLIHAHHPKDPEQLHEIIKISTEQMLTPIEQFHLYRPFKQNREEVFESQIDIQEIISHNQEMKKELTTFLQQSGGEKDHYIYMPLNARYHNVILIFSKNGDVKGTLNAPYKNRKEN